MFFFQDVDMAFCLALRVAEGGEYLSQGVYRGKATLPSQIVPGLLVHVEQYFVSVWKEDGK